MSDGEQTQWQRERAEAAACIPEYVDVLDGWFGTWIVAQIPRLIAAGWPDDEILEALARFRVHSDDPTTTPGVRVRRAGAAYLAALRGRPARQTRRDERRRRRVAAARRKLEQFGNTTDAAIAAALKMSERTIRQWRKDGSIE